MEFILSSFLWLLPLASIPLIFHLLNNRKFKTIDFSSIKLIDSLKTKSIKKLSIINILLLIIRMLIIIFIILSISRPIIKATNASVIDDPSSLSIVILIDDTFSNMNNYLHNSQIDNVKEKISLIINSYNEDTNIEISSIQKDLLFKGIIKDFDLSKVRIENSYKSGNISDLLIKYFNQKYTDSYLSGHMYILSDMEKSSLKHDFKNSWWDIIFVNTNFDDIDPLIAKITIDDKIVLPMRPFGVSMEIANNSNEDIVGLKASVYIDGVQLIQKIDIAGNSSKKIQFQGVIDERGSFDLIGELKLDNQIVGNPYFSKINVFPNLDICLCELENLKSAKYLKTAISVIADNNIFYLNECDASSYANLSSYDIVILDDYNLLNNQEMKLYIENGGHALFFPSVYEDSEIYLDFFELDIFLNQEYVTLLKENVVNSDIFVNIFKNMKDNSIFSVKDKYLLPVNSESVIEVPGKGALWNRIYSKRGLLDLFGFNFDIDNNDFALKGFFVPFIYSLLTSHNKIYPSEVFLGDSNLDEYETYEKKKTLLLTDGEDYLESFNSFEELEFKNIDSAGFYFILSENDTIKELIFNISPNEIDGEAVKFPILKQNYDKAILIDDSVELANYINKKLKSIEIWHLFLAIAIILLIIESLIINVFSRKQ